MHQAVKAYLANQRQGNAATKTRGFVIGGNQKPWKQKGTGRARQGSTRAPHWVGGGTVFGPTPRSYAQYVPRKVRALARKSAFNARARENAIIVIDAFDYDAPKTQHAARRCSTTLGVAEQEGADPHRRREAERVPERPEPAATSRDAVRRRVDVPHPLVGRRAHRGSALGRSERRIGDAEPASRDGSDAAQGAAKKAARKAAAKKAGEDGREEDRREEGTAKKARPAKKSAAKKKGK